MLPLLPRGSDANAIAVDPAGTTIVGNADTTTQAAMAVEWVNGAIKKLPTLGSTLTSGAGKNSPSACERTTPAGMSALNPT